MNTILDTFSISLFDSLSTTLQIIVFILLLTTTKPLRNTLSYLIGLSGSYFACGLVGYLALDQLRVLLNALLPSQATVPNSLYYQAELLMGLVMVAIGIWYFHWKKKRGWSGTENKILLKLKTMNSVFAFGMGVFISVTSFPASVPYMIALGKYSSLHLAFPAVMGLVFLYNLGYALPMILILLVYLVIRGGMEMDHDGLHEKARILNVHLTAWTMVGFGLFSLIDALWYFVFGHALVKDRFF